MNRLITLFTVLVFPILLTAQNLPELMGISSRGGMNGAGTIFTLSTDGADFKINHDFAAVGPFSGLGSLLVASDGKAYGMTSDGGNFRSGTIFKMNMDGSGFAVVHHFNGAEGAFPSGSLIESNGQLFGLTPAGGDEDAGLVFKINMDGSGFEVLHHFSDDAAVPFGNLVEASDGKLYGVASEGGANNDGAVFRINKDGTGFSTLFSFEKNTSGKSPLGALIEGSGGWLYGTACHNGPGQAGVVFRLKKDGSDFTLLRSFTFSQQDGNRPLGTLLEASDGKIYGTASSGGNDFNGIVFSMEKDGSNFQLLRGFAANDGKSPGQGSYLLEAANGMLYGVNPTGGTNNGGTVYRLNKDGSGFSVIHHFDLQNGARPQTGLAQTANGNLIGTATMGGAKNVGTIFSIDVNGDSYATVHEFDNSNANGYNPVSQPTLAADEHIYNTAFYGGSNGMGTVYRTQKNGTNFEVLHEFAFAEGANPSGKLLESSDGMLYGTTKKGGSFGNGTIYRLNPANLQFELLHHFELLGESGALPSGRLIEDANGMIFGTTQSGGANGSGVIFQFDKTNNQTSVVFSFSADDPTGNSPIHGLTEMNGQLYGVTQLDGDGNQAAAPSGTLFRVNKNGTGFEVLKHFDQNLNGIPSSPLLSIGDGFLYGTTTNGGDNLVGTFYKISLDGSGFQTLFHFDVVNGITPQGALIASSDNEWIYGLTKIGGSEDRGVVYRIKPDGSSFEKIFDFTGIPDSGEQPSGGLIWVEGTTATGEATALQGISLAPNPAAESASFLWENGFPFYQKASLRISTEIGKLVFQADGDLPFLNALLEKKSRQWSKGIYFVDLKMEGGVFREKLVLQK
ncbi:MAG TPA: hypothetical protein ENJ95_03715 [Bacteroidetes bacterium]|nr:hypothetical protein [Bacteroidota bacterium]